MTGTPELGSRAACADGARRLIDWAAGCALSDIPALVLARAATVLSDDLAAMIGARDEPEVARWHARVIERAQHREATVFRGGTARVARIDAAVANAVAADWLELDEGYRRTPCHAGLYVLPALLATAETRDLPCDELLRALALGYEVVTRVARGFAPRALNMQSHGRYAAIGAATVTALAERLPADAMLGAVNAAATMTNPSPRSHLIAGALVRNVWPAQGAWSGMMAIEWLACGIAGSPDGLFDVYADVLGGTPMPEQLTQQLGDSWALLDGYTKIYACCQHLHSAVEATLALRDGLLAQAPLTEIDRIEVDSYALAQPLMNPCPATTLGAKFSMPHAIAAALAVGSGGADAFAAATLARPDIDGLRARVRVQLYRPELPPPHDRPARVSITLRDGRTIAAECLSARGGPDRPLPTEIVTDKLRQLAAPVYPRIIEMLDPVRALEPRALARGWRATVDGFTGAEVLIGMAWRVLLILLATALGAGRAAAQDYPSRPVHLIVTFAPGGGSDFVARAFATRLGDALGQPIVIDNRAGANGVIGAEIAMHAAPDGYTMLLGAAGTMVVAPHLGMSLPFDPLHDFAPVSLAATSPFVVTLNPKVPATSIASLIAYAKEKPGGLNYGSSGSGGAPHLATELFAAMAGIRMVHVPYRGLGPAVADLLGGQIQVLFADLPLVVGHVRAGTLRAIAISGRTRSSVMPELPPVAEAGLPGYDASPGTACCCRAARPSRSSPS